jgi:FKBP-type peptidyl-prolyl cis-trans isomerase FklB
MKDLKYILMVMILFLIMGMVSSCSEDSVEEDEYANWQERNESTINAWAANNAYTKILTYTKTEGATPTLLNSDYIYVEKLESGSGTESPLFNDTIRVAYRLYYVPTKTYPQGYVVSETFTGTFNWNTIGVSDFVLSGSMIDGFCTAVLNMHVGDRWIVNIPYPLGYGNPSTRSDIYSGSNLIYDLALVDFWHPGETRPTFRARQK